MFYQIDDKIKKYQRDDECYVFNIYKIFEEMSGHTFTYKEIDDMHNVTTKAEFVGRDGWINENGIQGLASVASGITKKHVFIKRVSASNNYNFIIACFKRKLSNGGIVTHFVLVDRINPKIVIWDPYSPNGSKTVREGWIDSYRYIFAELL